MIGAGIPTVVFVNENFLPEAQMIAKARNIPSLDIVIVPANIEVLPVEEVEDIADKACRNAVELLIKA